MFVRVMKRILFSALCLFSSMIAANAQLDANRLKELNQLKEQSRINKTAFIIYDTIFYAGDPYCLMKTKLVSDLGDEYVVKNIKGEEILYIIEPDKIDKAISGITNTSYYKFTLLKEGQKLNIPTKSVTTLPDFIAENNLIADGKINMDKVKQLRLIHSDINPQQYTDNSTANDSTKATGVASADTVDMSKYLPVVRNRTKSFTAKDYVIKQDDKTIGYYEKSKRNMRSGDPLTVYTFFLPGKIKVAEAVNGGIGSTSYKVETFPTGRKFPVSTGFLDPVKDIVDYLIKYNIL